MINSMICLTYYNDNVDPIFKEYQKKVFNKLNIPLNQINFGTKKAHGPAIDESLANITARGKKDFIFLFDIDAFPLNNSCIEDALKWLNANNGLYGAVQVAAHCILDKTKLPHKYVAPSFVGFSADLYFNQLKSPKFSPVRGPFEDANVQVFDVGGYVTYTAEKNNVPINLIYPTHIGTVIPSWSVHKDFKMGKDVIYNHHFYHAFLSRHAKDLQNSIFVKYAEAVLQNDSSVFQFK